VYVLSICMTLNRKIFKLSLVIHALAILYTFVMIHILAGFYKGKKKWYMIPPPPPSHPKGI